METTSNMILTAIFGALAVWLLIGVVKTWGKTKYKDRTWTASRILFVVAAVMLVFTAFAYNGIWDIIRMAVMGVAIVAYLLDAGWHRRGRCMHDGQLRALVRSEKL